MKKPGTPSTVQASNQMKRAKDQLRKIQAMEQHGAAGGGFDKVSNYQAHLKHSLKSNKSEK